jgi:hypothetical protein
MVEIRGSVSKKISDEFRKLAMVKFGYKKGSISTALEEAVKSWIKSHSGKSKFSSSADFT